MATPLEILYGPRNIRSVVRIFSQEKKPGPLMELFMKKGKRDKQYGELVNLDKLTFGRGLAPFGDLASPSIRRSRLERGNLVADWCPINVSKTIPMQKVIDERYPGADMPDARKVLQDELDDLIGQVYRSVELICAGILWGDANGAGGAEINPTTVPGSEFTDEVDFGVQTLQSLAAWSNPSTAILSTEFKPIHRKGLSAGGVRYGLALHRADATDALLGNTEVGKWFLNVNIAPEVAQHGSLMARGGLSNIPKWIELEHGYDLDGPGTFTKFVPNKQIVFMPREEELEDVLGFAEGYIAVPRSGGDVAVIGAEQAPDMGDDETGIVAYAVRSTDPYGIKLIVQYRFLPVVRNKLQILRYDAQIS